MTGFGTAKSSVDRCVMRFFIIIAMFMLVALQLAIAVSDFGSVWIADAAASTSEPAVFSRAKTGHRSGNGSHGSWILLTEVAGEPLVPDAVFKGREGFGVQTIDNLVLFD